MVLGNAAVYALVDGCDFGVQRTRAVRDGHAVPALLQLSRSFWKVTSTFWHPSDGFLFDCLVSALTDRLQYWRLATTFLYFGPFSLDLLFHVYFLQRYSRLLEENSRSPAHFAWLLLYATGSLIMLSPFVSMPFLGHPLSSTLVYIWSRRNPEVRLSFLGLLVFTAPYLPWVLMAFSLVMHGTVPRDEIMGVVIGHVWYFFNDVYPPMHNGSRPLDPPGWWTSMFEGRTAATPVEETADNVLVAGAREVGAPDVQ